MSSPTPPTARWKLVLFSLLPAVLLFTLMEVGLRIAGFQHSETPLEVRRFLDDPQGIVDRELAWRNRDGVERFVKDRHQLWVPKTSPLERYPLRADPGVFRIATLGDSCTAYCVSTRDSFPKLADRFLNEQGGRRVEVLNAGVAAHSSHQGLQRLKHTVLPYQPDLITVYFGWNDHWISGTPDAEVALRGEFETRVVNVLDRLRLYQAGRWGLARWRVATRDEADPARPTPAPRVDLERYDANLREIVRIARAEGIAVLLLTAPQDLRDWNNAELQPLSTAELVALHARYNDVVRSVAAETGADLLDLDAIFEAQKPRRLIAKDGIHFNPQGCRFTAQAVATRIAERHLED